MTSREDKKRIKDKQRQFKPVNFFVTTDLHLGHENLCKYGVRPDGYEEKIWNGMKDLGENDILICLGDVAMKGERYAHEKYIIPLKCKKWLVIGNHDHKSNTFYLRNGWDFVSKKFYMKFMKKRILFSHKPQLSDGSFHINIFGHFHDSDHHHRERHLISRLTPNHRLLALELTNYHPVKLESLLDENSHNLDGLIPNKSRRWVKRHLRI